MNKTAIRNFAVWARNKLIADVSYHAGLLGITKNGISKALPQSTKDVEFYDIGTAEPYAIRGEEIQQRKSLVDAIRAKEKNSNYETAYSSLMEEVAYTWFNRLIAVRFMEVNDYLPEHVRVLSSESGKQEPDIVTTPFDAELFFAEGEQQKIIQMKNDNKLDEVFRILFIKQCRELSRILPSLFEGTNDYTELLLSLSFIDQEGVVYRLVHDIPEDDFNIEKGGQVEIIGWLYQYYNAELKDETFALLKNNVKVTKERIPSATQLFTPDWIVRYMVENSLGRLWVEGHPNDVLKSGWKYYLDEAEQEASVKEELEKIRSEYAKLNPEAIKVIDPCMGSGHILVYAFDVLMQIYESAGYTQRDAAKSILEHNLFGLDIDDRAAQLAYFAVMMKARQYNRRILDGETNCNVYAIKESNNFDREALGKLGDDLRPVAARLLDAFVDAKEYGSIITVDVTLDELDALDKRLDDVDRMSDYGNLLDMMYAGILCNELSVLIRQARVMVQKYDAVITNPPYMASGNMDAKLAGYVKKHYSDSKYDMNTVFMEKSFTFTNKAGYVSMINIPVWMFLSRYEGFRDSTVKDHMIINMLHCGRGIFGADFGTTAFVMNKRNIPQYKATYRRLFEKQSLVDTIEEKEERFFRNEGLFISSMDKYERIAGHPIAYWITDNELVAFEKGDALKDVATPRVGIITGNNDKFIKTWWEISNDEISCNTESYDDCLDKETKWYPYNKGGAAKDWYGNRELVVMFKNGGEEIKKHGDSTGAFYFLGAQDVFFHEGITWSGLTIGRNTFRYSPKGTLFDSNKGPMAFPSSSELTYYLLGLFNTKVVQRFLGILNPTVSLQAGDFEKIPILFSREEEVQEISKNCVEMSRVDYNSSETSLDFKKHPLV